MENEIPVTPMRAASPPRQIERENEMIVISQLLFLDGDGNITFHWLLPIISAILIASHCNSPENRDGREAPVWKVYSHF